MGRTDGTDDTREALDTDRRMGGVLGSHSDDAPKVGLPLFDMQSPRRAARRAAGASLGSPMAGIVRPMSGRLTLMESFGALFGHAFGAA